MKTILRATVATRPRRFLVLAASLVVAYALTGFFVVPRVAQAVATKQLGRALGREVSIERIETNPFKLTCRVQGLRVKDLDGERFFDWEEVFADLQIASLFRRQWVFKELSVVRPHGRLLIREDGELNLSDLIERYSGEPDPTAEPGKPLRLRIDRLSLSGATLALTDRTPSRPFHRLIGPLDLTINQFETSPESRNPYAFTGATDAGERFSWSGYFYLDPLRSEGEFSVEEIALNGFAPFYQDYVRFEIQDGMLGVRSGYRIELGASNLVASVTNTSIRLQSFKLAAKGASEALVELPELTLDGASADLVAREADIRLLSAAGGKVAVRRSEDATINVVEAAKPIPTDEPKPGFLILVLRSVTNLFSLALRSTNAWAATISEFSLTNFSAQLEDRVKTRPVLVQVDEVNLSAKDLSNRPNKRISASLSLRWNTNGTIRTSVEAMLDPPQADIGLDVRNVQLRPLDPYLEQLVDLFILNSLLDLKGDIVFRTGNGEAPEATFTGSMGLAEFVSVDSQTADELLKWQSLEFSDIQASLTPPTVAAPLAELRDAYARVVYETNGILNLQRVFHLDAEEETDARSPDAPPADRSFAAGVARKRGPETVIERLIVTNAHIELVDRSIDPNVNVSVQRIGGEVAGLSTRPDQRTSVRLTGFTENTGPLALEADFVLFDPMADAAFVLRAGSTDLHPANPYAGKYAGYRISKGKLDLNLRYDVKNRSLDGENLITLDQLALGEKTDSPDATKLPVKLAVAILKDREGRIELDVPVEGSLDDPEFRLGGVIAGAVGNVIGNLVTSPFRALSGLFGGKGEEVSYQDFSPGSAELSEEARAKLDAVANGLYERPSLQLEIVGAFDPVADGPVLRSRALERELRRRKWESLDEAERSNTSPDDLEFSAAERERWLRTAFLRAFPEAATPDNAEFPAESGTPQALDALSEAQEDSGKPAPTPPATSAPATEPGEPAHGAVTQSGEPEAAAAPARPRNPSVKGAQLLRQGFSRRTRGTDSEPLSMAAVRPSSAESSSAPSEVPGAPATAMSSSSETLAPAAAPPEEGPIDQATPTSGAVADIGIAEMERRLLETLELGEEAFTTLATDRAKAVMEYVIQNGKVEPDRVFLAEEEASAEKPEASRVYLQLQ